MTGRHRPGFWDLGYAAGDHRTHWESARPGGPLAALAAAGILRPGSRVLDVGCGGGLESIFLARRGFRVVAVDRSLGAIRELRRRLGDADGAATPQGLVAARADVRALPLRDASIDFAFDRGCLHVIDPAQRRRLARELWRVVRPTGSVLVHGARDDDEEAGVLSVDAAALDRDFRPVGFVRGPVIELDLDAPAGPLTGCLTVLMRPGRPPA